MRRSKKGAKSVKFGKIQGTDANVDRSNFQGKGFNGNEGAVSTKIDIARTIERLPLSLQKKVKAVMSDERHDGINFSKSERALLTTVLKGYEQ